MDNERGITNVTSIYTMVFFRIIFIISFLYLLKTGSYLPAFYLLILILIFEVAGLWSKLGLHKLHTQSILHPCRMFPGDKAELSIEIKNGKRLPTLLKWTQPLSKILKQVIKEGEAGAVSNGEIVTGKAYLGPFAEISRELYFTAQKRGYYKIPALQLQSRDVLGLFNRDSYVESKQHLAVYPRLLPLDSIEFKASDFSGLKRDSRPYLFDPIMFVGLRDYTPDMPARFISWKASAHKDRLLSKIVESSSSLRICIAIDVEAFMLPEPREEEFERALSIAASLAVWADNCRIPFGLVSNASMTGKHGNAIVPVNRSDDQGRQVLEALARVEFNTYGSLEAILKAEALHIPWGTTLIILGVERPILIPSTVRQVVYYGGRKMQNNSILLKLSLIFSETCFHIVFYYSIITGLLKCEAYINPVFLFILTGVLTIMNMFLSMKKMMFITIGLINSAVLVFLFWLASLQSGVFLFTFSGDAGSIVNAVLFQLTMVWLIFRSVYIAFKKKSFNVFGHFDLFICLTFLSFLISHLLKGAIPGGTVWVIIALFLNIFSLYIYSNAGEDNNPLAGWVLAAVVVLIIYLSKGSDSLFPHISGTAGFLYDIFEKSFMFIIGIFAYLISTMVKLTQRMRSPKAAEEGGSENAAAGGFVPAEEGPAWLNIVLQIVIGIVVVIFAILILALLYSLIRWMISRLLKRTGGDAVQASYDPFAYWKRLLAWIKDRFGKLGLPKWMESLAVIFLPHRMTIQLVYRQLLRWGALKRRPRKIQETPYDYCERLAVSFPEVSVIMEKITSSYVEYRYYESSLAAGSNKIEDKTVLKLRLMLVKLYLYDISRLLRILCRIPHLILYRIKAAFHKFH